MIPHSRAALRALRVTVAFTSFTEDLHRCHARRYSLSAKPQGCRAGSPHPLSWFYSAQKDMSLDVDPPPMPGPLCAACRLGPFRPRSFCRPLRAVEWSGITPALPWTGSDATCSSRCKAALGQSLRRRAYICQRYRPALSVPRCHRPDRSAAAQAFSTCRLDTGLQQPNGNEHTHVEFFP